MCRTTIVSALDSIREARFALGHWKPRGSTCIPCHKPNQRSGAYRREQTEEIYVVMAGSGRAKLDGQVLELHPFDAIRLAARSGRGTRVGARRT